jgi:hypothetical protein
MLAKLYLLSHTSSHFALVILEMGESHELFAWAGLEP